MNALGNCQRCGEMRPCACSPDAKLTIAALRVSAVADGRSINGAYRMNPLPALDAFKADLKLILAALPL